VVLADYGAGNLRSLSSALVRAGAEPVVSTDAREVREAPLALIAGVGNGCSASAALRERGLDEALRERAAAGRPLFGVCVGLQLPPARSAAPGAQLLRNLLAWSRSA